MSSNNTKIEWTERTWNPVRGCSRVSEGCRNCYAETFAARFTNPGQAFEGFAVRTPQGPRWTGKVELSLGNLWDPISWRKPSLVFVNSMSDLFHEDLPEGQIARIFTVMREASHHTYQILTKRPARMLDIMRRLDWWYGWDGESGGWSATICSPGEKPDSPFILPNVWLGVSVENQATADERIPLLLDLRDLAAVRFLSCEPLLGPLDLGRYLFDENGEPCKECGERIRISSGQGVICGCCSEGLEPADAYRVDWLIAGGESGRNARPCDPDWLRSLRDQCQGAQVPYFLKQLGGRRNKRGGDAAVLDGRRWVEMPTAYKPAEIVTA